MTSLSVSYSQKNQFFTQTQSQHVFQRGLVFTIKQFPRLKSVKKPHLRQPSEIKTDADYINFDSESIHSRSAPFDFKFSGPARVTRHTKVSSDFMALIAAIPGRSSVKVEVADGKVESFSKLRSRMNYKNIAEYMDVLNKSEIYSEKVVNINDKTYTISLPPLNDFALQIVIELSRGLIEDKQFSDIESLYQHMETKKSRGHFLAAVMAVANVSIKSEGKEQKLFELRFGDESIDSSDFPIFKQTQKYLSAISFDFDGGWLMDCTLIIDKDNSASFIELASSLDFDTRQQRFIALVSFLGNDSKAEIKLTKHNALLCMGKSKSGTTKNIYPDSSKFTPDDFSRDIEITRYGEIIFKFPIPISENESTELLPNPYIKPKSINPLQTIAEILNLSSTISKSQNLTIDEETKQKLHAELVALMRSTKLTVDEHVEMFNLFKKGDAGTHRAMLERVIRVNRFYGINT